MFLITLKTQGQIPKKQYVKNQRCRNTECQFAALLGIPCRSYLKKSTNYEKYFNKSSKSVNFHTPLGAHVRSSLNSGL